MKKLLSLLMALMVFTFASVGFAEENEYISAEGLAESGQTAFMGFRAAETDAYRNLLQKVSDVNIDSVTTVKNGMLISDVINISVKGKIKNAEKMGSWKDDEGMYHFKLRMHVFGSNGLVTSVVPVIENNPSNTLIPVNIPSGNTEGNYTGLIIDCRNLGIDTALAPVIKDDGGHIVYNYSTVDHEKMISRGMVAYSKSMQNTRAGANPLVIVASSVDNFINPVVSLENAQKIINENSATHFFDEGNVVFIR